MKVKNKSEIFSTIIIIMLIISYVLFYFFSINKSGCDTKYITTPNGTRVEIAKDCVEYNSNVEFGQVVDYNNEFKVVIIYNGYSNAEYKCDTEFKAGSEVCVVFTNNGDVDEILEVTEENIVYD